jgi:hypothetical protein
MSVLTDTNPMTPTPLVDASILAANLVYTLEQTLKATTNPSHREQIQNSLYATRVAVALIDEAREGGAA